MFVRFRRGTESQWNSANPILLENEIARVIETGRFKVGNGIQPFIELSYSDKLPESMIIYPTTKSPTTKSPESFVKRLNNLFKK